MSALRPGKLAHQARGSISHGRYFLSVTTPPVLTTIDPIRMYLPILRRRRSTPPGANGAPPGTGSSSGKKRARRGLKSPLDASERWTALNMYDADAHVQVEHYSTFFGAHPLIPSFRFAYRRI